MVTALTPNGFDYTAEILELESRGPSIFLDEPTCRGRSKGHCPQGRYFEALKNAHKNEMFVLAIIIISLQ